MTVMTIQPPLSLIPVDAAEISAAAAMVEDDDGGRVYVHGNLCFAGSSDLIGVWCDRVRACR